VTAKVSYLICSMRRSGGGLLAGLLRSTGVAARPEEYFWENDIPRWRKRWSLSPGDDYLSRVVEEGTTPNGVFGARVMWSYLDDVIEQVAGAETRSRSKHEILANAFPDLHYVYLSREDRLAQAVSWAKAIQTDEWFAGDRHRIQREPTFDRSVIEGLLGEIASGERGWRSFFADGATTTLHLKYETIARHPLGTGRDVLSFLGVAADDVRFDVQTRRQADHLNESWIERFKSADHW
jgi:LPS sulfotransferase NodH